MGVIDNSVKRQCPTYLIRVLEITISGAVLVASSNQPSVFTASITTGFEDERDTASIRAIQADDMSAYRGRQAPQSRFLPLPQGFDRLYALSSSFQIPRILHQCFQPHPGL
jgi:hypothetical protein